ncbi:MULTISPECIES: Hpt domain-containing protein [unclassified Pseudodesulfovibrio]|uniref:Hpt domain-containing protein n=1 Tax=unclassified Pseudodesulfovibrio TaxID=2661612 RepID=UPI000FEC149A|nr:MULTISPECIES: Hpt domain-containing protein [unclassified Pseudodesulfovibrio]MCJ2164167.1 Hpt domain-containing protein [Pseudodesulfovibrio sp. S3-i]RWU05206.1 Hpt domain-containing protein [Pseudodesulfovibrio sp. S3]
MPKYPIIERIDPDLGELLDRFFDVSHKDLEAMQGALAVLDFEELVRLGHTAKGTGSGYGFKGMGDIGHGIELAANARDLQAAKEQVEHLARYLDTVQVEFNDYPGGNKK